VHSPIWQTVPDRQALPHPPQLAWSLVGSTQAALGPPLQGICPPGHAHAPSSQT
jgi:hypothetical protein